MKVHHTLSAGFVAMLVAACSATTPTTGQQAAATPPAGPAAPVKPAAAGPDSLQVLFAANSSDLSSSGTDVVEHAARLFREGNPVIMTIAGHSDAEGAELPNLVLSAKRAETVKAAMVARGIPADRLEAVAYGVAEPAVPNNPTASENRRVVITWR